MKKNLSLIGVLLSCFGYSQPKLIVGVVVDQMRYDYIERYWKKFGDNGFKRLVNEGYNCKNTNYNYVPTFTGPGHASIYTGATPSVHGIISNDWFDRDRKVNMYCVQDNKVQPVGTTNKTGRMSPENLMSATITDELRKATNNEAKVIGIALKDRGAILPVGKQATAAYWYDGTAGKWISSTYYMNELPVWVNRFNDKAFPAKYLSQVWTTAQPAETYTESDEDDSDCERSFIGKPNPTFPYDLPYLKNMNGGFDLLCYTPFGNTLTKDFAIELIENEKMGIDSVPDFLTLSFSSTDYIGHQFGPQSMEVEDCYIRLDKEIAELLACLDEKVGKKNYLLFLTADHGASDAYPCLMKKGVSAGVIREDILSDSLKQFFKKNYHNDSLLLATRSFDIYLNRDLIFKEKINLDEIANNTVNYMMSLKGITCILVAPQVKQETFEDSIKIKMQAGYNDQRSGDLIYALKPYWLLGPSKGTTHGSPYLYDTHVPLIFYGWNIPKGVTNLPINITDIAPTISNLLNINGPKGSTGSPIKTIKHKYD